MSLKQGMIRAERLSKSFRHFKSGWQRLAQWLGFTAAGGGNRHIVLDDVSFTIEAGSAVGIVGRNGAGKSTLLKLLTGTLDPSSGGVHVTGKVAALLELGMGFHPDLTGRQNAYISGALQGISQEEMTQLMPAIAAYAEIGEAFDQPLRTYSSGMQVRLAFSVATARRPDILIVDEALSVGDAYFQHKCFRRIRHFLDDGVTLLFVSHDPLSIKSLCDRAMLLDGGRVVLDDEPLAVLDYYNALIAEEDRRADAGEKAAIRQHGGQTASGNRHATIVDTAMLVDGQRASSVVLGRSIVFRVCYRVEQPVADLTVGFMIRDRLGNEIFGINSAMLQLELPVMPLNQNFIVDFELPAVNLGPGAYNVSVALHRSTSHLAGNYDWRDQALTFQVGADGGAGFAGVAYLPCRVSLSSTV